MKRKGQIKKPPRQIRTVSLHVGQLTASKHTALMTLRTYLLLHAQAMAELVFVADPLTLSHDPERLATTLSTYQKAQRGINKAYLQIVGKQVQQAAFEQEKRYFARLLGRLRHVASEIPKAEQTDRLHYYVPVDVQSHVTDEDFAKLSALPEEMEFGELRALLRSRLIDGQANGFTLIQLAILQEIHAQALKRHRPLSFKNDDETSLSIPLDYRMLPVADKNLADKLSPQVQLLLDGKNKQYQFFLSVAHPIPRQERLQLPVTIKANVVERLLKADKAAVNSLTLVLGKDRIGVRMAVAKPKTLPTTKPKFLVARDFGYVNTISLSVIRLDEELDQEKLAAIQAFTKEAAKKFLTTHSLPSGNDLVVERQRFSGRKFLEGIAHHCLTIDRFRAWIDVAYQKLDALKTEIVQALGLQPEVLLTDDGSHPKLKQFFVWLAKINQWKAKRRATYQQIAGLKQSWFGYLSNLELKLAKKYQATVVRENLTVIAIETDDPRYRGRVFNKMLNNGAQGQYKRQASEKFLWYGVPEIVLPSFYTSQTCTIHAVVEEKQRQGEAFRCVQCQGVQHADEHAADTIGLYALLRPNVTNILPVQTRSSGL